MKHNSIIALACLLFPLLVNAKTLYIDDRLMVGVYNEKNVDTPIVKLLPGGTALDLIKQDQPLSQVRDPDGVIGWIENQYLVDIEPGRAQLTAAQARIAEMEAELSRMNANGLTDPGLPVAPIEQGDDTLLKENEELKQLLKSERLRAGELQAKTAELKSRLSGTPKPLLDTEKLDQLTRENEQLKNQLSAIDTAKLEGGKVDIKIGEFNWKKFLATIGISLCLGIVIGIYILDLIMRKRHGGFRI